MSNLKKIHADRLAREKAARPPSLLDPKPLAAKPLTPRPIMTKPLASPKPLVAKPLPTLTADQKAANARTLKGLQNLRNNGDLPDYFARPLRDTAADKGVMAEYKDFMGQLKTADPKRAAGFHKEVMGKLDPATQAKIAPYAMDKADVLKGGAGKDSLKPPTDPRVIAAMDDAGLAKEGREAPSSLKPFLDKTEKRHRGMVDQWRKGGMTEAADNLEHYLSGNGKEIQFSREQAQQFRSVAEAEKKNLNRFTEQTFTGVSKGPEVRKLTSIQDGQTVSFKDDWDGDIMFEDSAKQFVSGDRNQSLALGQFKNQARGKFSATRKGRQVFIKGTVQMGFKDTYDFSPDQPGGAAPLALEKHRGAKPFDMKAEWTYPVKGVVQIGPDGKLKNPNVTYGKPKETRNGWN